ncbi:ABC transporter permease [Clostridium ganghwense]|uniref:FtsX-like permease family protein n=1 Tax=Clostridium ganghwense TaxID=312089 RepID=A0ABT4CNH0_9CLOT|nr:ABC transporter permease [Clostridium ganghwense]MCY6370600.1 FtsX-like permease family protein [Clostridium ganghwense]
MRNNNQKVINNLSRKSLKNNKLRNTFAIIAIVLTTVLFTTLFTLSMGMVKAMQEQTMRQVGTSAHAGLKYLTYEEYNNIKNHPLIKDIGYSVMVGFAENKELIKRQTEIRFATDNTAKWGFCYPTKGKMPQKINEVVTDTIVLDMLGLPHKIGVPITFEYTINGKKITKDFVLSGYWEGDIAAMASMAYVSQEFIDKNLVDIDQKYQKENNLYPGLIFADIMFDSSWGMEKNIQTVVKESGYELKNIAYGVNWAYMSTNFTLDPTMILSSIGGILLITFTGYLIIYNIFQISVTKDIRFYGLLKTIGTTSKQIKKLVRKQAYLLSAIGIPIGLILGYILGVVLLPVILSITSINNSSTSASPLIFIGAALFSLITVYISSRKPSKIASKVSPVEAVRYTGIELQYKKKSKKSSKGAKIHKMAWSNLFRNKKKTIVVIISMSLSLILLNAVYTITSGFNMDKYLSHQVVSDFIVGHVNYFNSHFRSEEYMPSQKLIDKIKNIDGIEEGGKTYYTYNLHQLSKKGMENYKNIFNDEFIDKSDKHMKDQLIKSKISGEVSLDIYGLNNFLVEKLSIVEGKFDAEKFATGKYVLVSPLMHCEDPDNSSYYNIGDKITIKFDDNTEKTYEVMAKARIPHNMSLRRYITEGMPCFLPSSEFQSQVKKPMFINYVFDIDDKNIETMEKFLENYTNNIETMMDYKSKQTYVDSFKQLQNTYLIVGGVLCFIVGFIGILNFINSMLTSIITRKREFAMLKSIGMTKKQLYKMLIFEGIYYAILTIAITLTVGNAFSYIIVQAMAGQIWFFTYHFTILPVLIASPILIIVSILVPLISYKETSQQSIVEQLRENV